jgi:superoxide dismutase
VFVAAPAFAEYTVPDLTYPYEALEPYVDAATMRFHHDKHHGARAHACKMVLRFSRASAREPRVNSCGQRAALARPARASLP